MDSVTVVAHAIASDFFPHDTQRRDNLAGQIADALRAYGDARAGAERARCLKALDGLYHADACRVVLRALNKE